MEARGRLAGGGSKCKSAPTGLGLETVCAPLPVFTGGRTQNFPNKSRICVSSETGPSFSAGYIRKYKTGVIDGEGLVTFPWTWDLTKPFIFYPQCEGFFFHLISPKGVWFSFSLNGKEYVNRFLRINWKKARSLKNPFYFLPLPKL